MKVKDRKHVACRPSWQSFQSYSWLWSPTSSSQWIPAAAWHQHKVQWWCSSVTEGLSQREMIAVCESDGQWSPNPGGVTCSPRPTQSCRHPQIRHLHRHQRLLRLLLPPVRWMFDTYSVQLICSMHASIIRSSMLTLPVTVYDFTISIIFGRLQ